MTVLYKYIADEFVINSASPYMYNTYNKLIST